MPLGHVDDEMRDIVRQAGITVQAIRNTVSQLNYRFPHAVIADFNSEMSGEPMPPLEVNRARSRAAEIEERNRIEEMEPLRTSTEFSDLMYRKMYDNAVCKFLTRNSYLAITERVNYVALDGNKLSYMPKGRSQESWPDGTWREEGRQTGKPARIARMMIPKHNLARMTDADFEEFANIIKAENVLSKATFEMFSGSDIRRFYNENMYMTEQHSSLTQSCMRYYKCRSYFGVYTENPDIVSMLVLQDDDTAKIHGRAIVWSVPGFNTKIMDRVYGTESVQHAFREYARGKGWIYRAYNSFENETTFIHNNEIVYLDICVQLPNYKFDYYPYLDTMKFFDRKNGTFSNRVRNTRYDKNQYITALISTRGDGSWGVWDSLPAADKGVTSYVKSMGKPLESYADDYAPEDPDYMDPDDDYEDDDDGDLLWPVSEDEV
jgi:hypothetical protein